LIVSALCTSSNKIVTEITLIQLNISNIPKEMLWCLLRGNKKAIKF
jgi:hypothetical protein